MYVGTKFGMAVDYTKYRSLEFNIHIKKKKTQNSPRKHIITKKIFIENHAHIGCRYMQ